MQNVPRARPSTILYHAPARSTFARENDEAGSPGAHGSRRSLAPALVAGPVALVEPALVEPAVLPSAGQQPGKALKLRVKLWETQFGSQPPVPSLAPQAFIKLLKLRVELLEIRA